MKTLYPEADAMADVASVALAINGMTHGRLPLQRHVVRHFTAIKVLQNNLDAMIADARKIVLEHEGDFTMDAFYDEIEVSRKIGGAMAAYLVKNQTSITIMNEEEEQP
jgi:hypothetical protein